jgi:hypothetical protein
VQTKKLFDGELMLLSMWQQALRWQCALLSRLKVFVLHALIKKKTKM